MTKVARVRAFAVASAMLAGCSGHNGALPVQNQPAAQSQGASSLTQSASMGSIAKAHNWKPIYTTLPATGVNFDTLDAQAAAGATIPSFGGSVKSPLDGNTYSFRLVGANPHTSKVTTNITYVPLVARIHFPDGTVLDPSLPGCGDTVSVTNRFYKGPNFVPVEQMSNSISVGTVQANDADRRAEFWSLVKGTGYHTKLVTMAAPKVIDINAPAGSQTVPGVCAGKSHRIGEIDFSAYDSIVRKINAANATTTQLPLLLSYNTVEFQSTPSNCCIIGYHNAVARTSGTQVYAVGAYMDPGVFSVPIEDIHAWTHEIGELFDDPFINNATPAWGHVGQQSACQNNLEVGDPLTGTPYLIKVGGFTYHPQELAFFDWFFRTPAEGTGAEYSFEGTFETAQGACQ